MRNNASITRVTVVSPAMAPSLVSFHDDISDELRAKISKKEILISRAGYNEISYISLSSGIAGTIARTDGGP